MLRRTIFSAFVLAVISTPMFAEEGNLDGKGLECRYHSSFLGDRRLDEETQPLRYRQLRTALRHWIFEDGKVFSPRVQGGSPPSISRGIGLSYSTTYSSISWGRDDANFRFSLNQGIDDYGETWWELVLAGVESGHFVIFKSTCSLKTSGQINAALQKEVDVLKAKM